MIGRRHRNGLPMMIDTNTFIVIIATLLSFTFTYNVFQMPLLYSHNRFKCFLMTELAEGGAPLGLSPLNIWTDDGQDSENCSMLLR